MEGKQRPQNSANTVLQRAERCCNRLTHLNKHSKEELTAELLDSLGRRLFIITVRGLFLDFLLSQAELRAAFCSQTGRKVTEMRVKTRRKLQLSHRSVCFRPESCLNVFIVEMVPTQGRSEQPVDHDVSVASDGGGEVSVERNVEGVVLKKFLLFNSTGAEVECHLEQKRSSDAQIEHKTVSHGLLQLVLSSHLHGSGTHVCEDFFSGAGILVITNSCTEALLHVAKSGTKY